MKMNLTVVKGIGSASLAGMYEPLLDVIQICIMRMKWKRLLPQFLLVRSSVNKSTSDCVVVVWSGYQ